MRKITPKEDEQKRKNRNQWIVGGILIFVMVFSLLGYSLNSQNSTGTVQFTYNGLKFVKISQLWTLQKDNLNFSFSYNPGEVQKINTPLNLLNTYSNKPLYISSDNEEATAEIYRNLFYQNGIAQRVQEACLNGTICNSNLPVKNCDDNFIIIKENNQTGIFSEGNCVFIEGKMENLTQLSDSFLYRIIGVQ